jgi:hypothetical protein
VDEACRVRIEGILDLIDQSLACARALALALALAWYDQTHMGNTFRYTASSNYQLIGHGHGQGHGHRHGLTTASSNYQLSGTGLVIGLRQRWRFELGIFIQKI